MCLSGPEAERLFCGGIVDDCDAIDIAMARRYLSKEYKPLMLGVAFNRMREAARRLVRTVTVRCQIEVIADALLRYGSLSSDEIIEVLAC
jgi:hypothetical protein